ncbi:hypothetical protein [Streptomyces sparsogenes]|uniref:Uncharacterized protein n=1 Tax=Streptomyces sparsogenes DSM 40356 TaxID=1331668 RepID=A0A1R1S9H7_9ACTN|nr:hypothetical protein [Streptomyces sparsogenes]OMI34852.1 hypothetical protein SPAR_34276 [Streptomyces sparsogenes DSM 40356]
MTNNGQVALAFTGGYLLGRGHRVRSAIALAGLTAGRRFVTGRGMSPERLMSSELGKLSHEVRHQLMAAGRSAAVSAASHRIDALSDRLEQRASALRSGSAGPKGDEGGEEDEEGGLGQVGKVGKVGKVGRAAKEAGGSRARGEGRGGERKSGGEERSRGERGERETRQKRTGDRPERPRKKAGAGEPERRGRG